MPTTPQQAGEATRAHMLAAVAVTGYRINSAGAPSAMQRARSIFILAPNLANTVISGIFAAGATRKRLQALGGLASVERAENAK